LKILREVWAPEVLDSSHIFHNSQHRSPKSAAVVFLNHASPRFFSMSK
jgi:hypothetical protein